MAIDLNLQSYEQILDGMIKSLQSRVGLSDDTIGAVTLSILESASQSDFLINSNILAALDSISIDRATGTTLDKIGFSESLSRIPATKASGPVTITDTSFTKISSQIYANRPPPISGATIIYVNDASSFPASGRVYIGRGTAQVEGPIQYTAITQVGAYYQITLSAGLNKNHNTGETVILSQGGNRTIQNGASIQTPASGASSQVTFNTINNATIEDGETTVTGVSVLCTENDTTGNIPANTLTTFLSLPFPNATVTNPSPFSNATNVETDFDYRERIKQTRQSRSRGTNVALINAVLNLVATDEQKRVSSAAVEEAATVDLPTILRIDDGTAYEPIFSGIGNEIILDSALGGENVLQLNSTPVVKAQLTSINVQPFAIYDDYKLSVLVGGELSEHSFQSSDFKTPGAATAYEIVASINADTDLLFAARSASGANKVTIFAKSDSNEDIEVVAPSSGSDANTILAFPESHQYTLLLYKNDQLLTKDGSEALIESNPYPWNLSLTSYTFILSTDGTPAATYTFNSTTLAPYTPATAPLSRWVTAFNQLIPGITALSINNLLLISSNKGQQDSASLSIGQGTLVSIGNVFSTLQSTGKDSDYSLIRGTGQIKLNSPAVTGDNFKAGTENFQAYFETNSINNGIFNLSATGNFWFTLDSTATFITTTIAIGSNISVSNPATNIYRYVGPANTFSNVAVGDWAVIWDEAFSANNRGYWRVSNVTGTYIDVEKSTGTLDNITITNTNSFKIVRTASLVQQGYLPSGSYALDGAVTALNNVIIGATASVVNGNKLRISTNTYLENGFIALITADRNGQTIGFNTFLTRSNGVQHIAAIESGNSEIGSPLFGSSIIAASNNSSSPRVFNASTTQFIYPDTMLYFTRPLSVTRYSSNRFNQSGVRNLVATNTAITLVDKLDLKEIITGDKAYNINGFDFSYDDKLNVVLDNNPDTQTLILPTYREIEVAASPAPTINSFSAVDVDGGSVSLTTTFGADFDFNNYRLAGKGVAILNPSGTNNAIVIRTVPYGLAMNQWRVGIQLPLAPNTALTMYTSLTASAFLDNIIVLPSNAAKTVNFTPTSQFSITSSGPPYTMFVTYLGGSSPPAFVTNGVVIGDVLNIGANSSFTAANKGSFRITAVSQTALSVFYGSTGAPVNQTLTLSSATDLQIFSLTNTTANMVITAINNGPLNTNITAALGVGENGTGIIFTSTTDDTNNPFVTFQNGMNFIKTASLTSSPQFTTESNFSVTAFSLFNFVGERFRLIPYTAKQTATFLSSKAVSSINNIAGLKQNEQGNKIQINSQNFGTLGAVKVVSGAANAVGGSIVGSASSLTGGHLLIRSTQGASKGINSNSWIKITSALPLNKSLNFNATTSLQIVSSTYNVQVVGGTGTFNTSISNAANATTVIQVNKVNEFAIYSYNSGTAPAFAGFEGAWAQIGTSSGFSTQNKGIFRIIRSDTSSFWVENPTAIEETVTLNAGTDIAFYNDTSIMPGDSIIVSGGLLGATNDGTYTVESVSASSLTVSVLTPFQTLSAPTVLAGNTGNFASTDAKVTNFYKKIYTFQDVSSVNSTLCDIIAYAGTTSFDSKISDVFQCSFEVLNKLDFDTRTFFGIDSYLAYEGLIKEATRVIYGDTANPNTYPGVKAAGAYIDIQPPLPRKITLSVGVRLRTGVSFSTIQNNIKSVAAGVINSVPIGQSISISDILGAIRGIEGIFAVSMISPAYDVNNDIIVINPGEKPICDASVDVSVTLLGG